MRINIAATHRFHLLDLARELEKHGHEVRFYSYVPKHRSLKFGLKIKNSYSMALICMPLIMLQKIFGRKEWIVKLTNKFIDYILSITMKPCDIFIALGTVYKRSFIKANSKYNAITIMEWGSKHILIQEEILKSIPNFNYNQSKYFTDRTISMYEFVDYIAISSDHVKESFINKAVNRKKLFQNPYGVDLKMFKPTVLEDENYDIIMVGGWSYRKGCDLLTELCLKYNYTLLHVGSIVDIEFPIHPNMTHHNSVDQKELTNFYSRAKIFVLPSREEGLALVQPQALVSGLPIVCSKDTGGRDLRKFIDNQDWIIEMSEFSLEELNNCVVKALALASTQSGLRNYATNIENRLSWKEYGNRYNNFIMSINKR